jgi:predicted permease
MSRTNPIDALRGLAREGARVAFLPRRLLVIVQVTLSMVLLVGAGLLARSLSQLENQPMGFEVEDRLVVRIDPPPLSGDPERLAAIYRAMQERLQRIAGVRRASYSLYSPMEGNNWSSGIAIEGRPVNPENRDGASWNRIGPGYFETLGTRVVRGRAVSEADTPASARVAVVNLAFVRAFLADRDPIGVGVGLGDARNSRDYRIVGVVEDVKYTGASQPTRPMMFFPTMQLVEYGDAGTRQVQARSTLMRAIELHVAAGTAGRTGALEPEIRRALAEVHPDITVTRVVPMDVQVAGNFRNSRLLATLASTYGLIALALAALGLYGVTSYGVTQRQHEIGVRMALGADRARIVVDVLRGALQQTAIGLAIGVPLALWGSRALSTQLYEVTGRDPAIVALSAVTLAVSAALSALLPARRASSVDPCRALRAQ